jgi:hypothetical protein
MQPIKIYLFENDKLIVKPNEPLSPPQAEMLQDTLNRWQSGELKNLIVQNEFELIDMRQPNEVRIREIVTKTLKANTKQVFDAIIGGIAESQDFKVEESE